ncbi:hypothetical protein AMTR_s00044p00142610 [Amborella trichopoda]|uniref:Uncharacterized protein n=1 Tax=Amborella trichopoda TaxID=13333 RepID=U5D4M5_AMBTC|nr:hypothetical protein AMTR_s00044p00142610 [Amborella trichopoda]
MRRTYCQGSCVVHSSARTRIAAAWASRSFSLPSTSSNSPRASYHGSPLWHEAAASMQLCKGSQHRPEPSLLLRAQPQRCDAEQGLGHGIGPAAARPGELLCPPRRETGGPSKE